MVRLYIPSNLARGHKAISSYTEEGNKRLLIGLKVAKITWL